MYSLYLSCCDEYGCLPIFKKHSLVFLTLSRFFSSDRLSFSLGVAITFLHGHMALHLSFRCVTGFLSRIVFLDSTNMSQDYILNYPSIYCQLNLQISL